MTLTRLLCAQELYQHALHVLFYQWVGPGVLWLSLRSWERRAIKSMKIDDHRSGTRNVSHYQSFTSPKIPFSLLVPFVHLSDGLSNHHSKRTLIKMPHGVSWKGPSKCRILVFLFSFLHWGILMDCAKGLVPLRPYIQTGPNCWVC